MVGLAFQVLSSDDEEEDEDEDEEEEEEELLLLLLPDDLEFSSDSELLLLLLLDDDEEAEFWPTLELGCLGPRFFTDLACFRSFSCFCSTERRSRRVRRLVLLFSFSFTILPFFLLASSSLEEDELDELEERFLESLTALEFLDSLLSLEDEDEDEEEEEPLLLLPLSLELDELDEELDDELLEESSSFISRTSFLDEGWLYV